MLGQHLAGLGLAGFDHRRGAFAGFGRANAGAAGQTGGETRPALAHLGLRAEPDGGASG